MVDIELELQIRLPKRIDERGRVGEIVEEIARYVARVDRLQKQIDAALGEDRRRIQDGATVACLSLGVF